jgi:DNA-binding transcriptional regulator YiaG
MIVAAVVHGCTTENFELGGYEVRFLRKAIGLTQQRLADLIGVDRVTVARWETHDLEKSLGGMTSIALRTVLVSAQVEGGQSMRVPASEYREPTRPHPSRLELDAPL